MASIYTYDDRVIVHSILNFFDPVPIEQWKMFLGYSLYCPGLSFLAVGLMLNPEKLWVFKWVPLVHIMTFLLIALGCFLGLNYPDKISIKSFKVLIEIISWIYWVGMSYLALLALQAWVKHFRSDRLKRV